MAREVDAINRETDESVAAGSTPAENACPGSGAAHAASLVAVSDGHERSFRVCVMPPEGRSYAEDIAVKYGVTYELLTKPV